MTAALETSTAPVRSADPPDEELVARMRAGDTGAYEIVLRRYNRRLFRVTRSILRDDDDAQDAMQEAYVRTLTHLADYRTPGNFGAWLTRIAINEALMKKRRDQRLEHAAASDTDDDIMMQTPAPGAGTEDLAANAELRRLIETAVDRLPDNCRTVFVLRAIEQLSIEETAAHLDIPAATVKTKFHRARGLMQQALVDHIEAAGLAAFDFAGSRCDRMVAAVLARVSTAAGRVDNLTG